MNILRSQKCSVAGSTQKIRVKLVDFGIQRIANASDIGFLGVLFMEFPVQSIKICLLHLIPWNYCSWNDGDTMYVTTLLSQNRGGQPKTRFEMCVQFEVEPNLIFASNLHSTGFDYAKLIMAKDIARYCTSNDFIQHVKEKQLQLKK